MEEDEIREHIRRYQAGDIEAAAPILEHNERIVRKVASKYYRASITGDAQWEDLLQEGRAGMLDAVMRFDLARREKFLTYAWHYIRLYIIRRGREQGQSVIVPEHINESAVKLARASRLFEQAEHRRPTTRELKTLTGVSAAAQAASKVNIGMMSLEDPLGGEDGDSFFGDYIGDESIDIPADAEDRDARADLLAKVNYLPEREREIVSGLFGLNGTEITARELAPKLGITESRVNQLKNQALRKLREMYGKKHDYQIYP